ncbi:MAG: type IV pilin [Methanocalculus sp.]|uniref:type IV pilin n=1 Tax=Methanocalculus sp. TaxID=2004547 RepID=UPI002717DF75|nr:type IV pilin [Methanocalculus sp.]MDO9540218.1 type IV pilin [Methanocalculus sp.]
MLKKNKLGDNAVSPVVGVMLMLVVTIIIAAVVSGFAGTLVGSERNAPQMVLNTEIRNTGSMGTSFIVFDVMSVSEPIPTKDLQIMTSWRTTNKDDGTIIQGGATVNPGVTNTNFTTSDAGTTGLFTFISPIGFGQGVTLNDGATKQTTVMPYNSGQFFGNFTLTVGTSMRHSPARYGPGHTTDAPPGGLALYEYHPTHIERDNRDSVQAILGKDWNHLRVGDTVNIRFVHTPSGKVIVDNTVVVQG